jgi:hypothetical protein
MGENGGKVLTCEPDPDFSRNDLFRYLQFLASAITHRWHHIYPSLFKTYLRLKELGYQYIQGKIVVPSVINKKPRMEVYYD